MENQNSTGQETRKGFNLHGKKKWVIIICIAVFLLGSCVARGVGLRGSLGWGNRGWGLGGYGLMGTGNTAAAIKDFEPLGIVFAEATASRRNGYGTIHDMLMREAVAKGADGIINVNIAPKSGVFNVTWAGSALAIKY